MEQQAKHWMLVSDVIRKDAPYFGAIGIVFAIVQLVGFRLGMHDLGTDLMMEQIVFKGVLLGLMFIWLLRFPVELMKLKRNRSFPWLERLIDRAAQRTVSAAVAAAMVIGGTAIVAAFDRDYRAASLFVYAFVYFIAIAEAAANPLLETSRQSRMQSAAMGVLIGLPFGFSLVA